MTRSWLIITLIALLGILSLHSPNFIPDGRDGTDTEVGGDGTVGGGPGL